MKADHNQTEIARILGVDISTISREFRRNTGGRGYRPHQAQQLCQQRRTQKSTPHITTKAWRMIERLLRQLWSPEQICSWLRQITDVEISREWIYQHVLADKRAGGLLYRHLRCQKQRPTPRMPWI